MDKKFRITGWRYHDGMKQWGITFFYDQMSTAMSIQWGLGEVQIGWML